MQLTCTYLWVLTTDHLPKGHAVAETVRWLIRVHWHVYFDLQRSLKRVRSQGGIPMFF